MWHSKEAEGRTLSDYFAEMRERQGMIVGKVKVIEEVSVYEIECLLNAAFDWRAPWLEAVDVVGPVPENADYMSEILAFGGKLRLKNAYPDEDYPRTIILTRAKFIKGIQKYIQSEGKTLSALMNEHDAPMADMILQYAVFGDYVFD